MDGDEKEKTFLCSNTFLWSVYLSSLPARIQNVLLWNSKFMQMLRFIFYAPRGLHFIENLMRWHDKWKFALVFVIRMRFKLFFFVLKSNFLFLFFVIVNYFWRITWANCQVLINWILGRVGTCDMSSCNTIEIWI